MKDLEIGSVDKAIKKMDHIVGIWFETDPILLGTWCLVDKIADPKMDTMGIDTRSRNVSVRYNPNFVNSLSSEYLEAIMVSENFKILLKHPTTRLQNPKKISSMASQVTINHSVLENIFDEDDMDFVKNPTNFGLKNGLWFELYFKQLNEIFDEVMKTIEFTFGESSESQDGNSSESQYKEFKNQSDALKDYMNPQGSSNQFWGENELFDADVTNMVNDNKGSTKKWGKFTGDQMGEIVSANTPKIDYKSIVRRFNNSVISSKSISSRMKANRRYDLEVAGRKRVYTSSLLFAIDISGSMSDDELSEGLAVVNSLCKHSKITFMTFDTEIKSVETKYSKAKNTFKILGRGGTDFNCITEYAEKHNQDGLIIFTDGYASPPKQPMNTKTLWLLLNQEQKNPSDFGQVAYLQDR